MLHESRAEFIKYSKSIFPKADDAVLTFIANFVFFRNESEVIRDLFSNGYCYHFACMLNATFPDGKICYVAPYSHIIWLKDNIPYDVNGVYDGDSTKFIPIEFLGAAIADFKHNPNIIADTSKEEIARIIKNYDIANS